MFFSSLRAMLTAGLWLATSAAVPASAQTQAYPSKPITILLGFSAGGSADGVMRALGGELSKQLGQPVTVDNRPGAAGAIATQAAMAAPANGYTLLFAGLQLATGPHLNKVTYNPQTDLTMVRQVTSVPVVMLVPGDSPIRSAADISALAKKKGGSLSIGTGGVGTTGHFGTFVLGTGLGIQPVHVPFRGGAPGLQSLAGGELDLMFDQPSSVMQGLIDAKKIRIVSVMQEKSASSMPDIKSASEIGLPLEVELRGWQGIAVKTGTPAPVIAQLNNAIAAAVASPAFKVKAAQFGMELITNSNPESFQKYYLAELDRWGAFIRKYQIKAE
jgi:tripartite-type tricarboxylate transporter receptor subunit TctC